MRRLFLTAFVGVFCAASLADAQQISVAFSITNTVRNEFGEILPGSSKATAALGKTYVEGAFIQILDASDGIFPPDTNGVPHTSNSVVETTRIGAGTSPQLAKPGRASGRINGINRSSSKSDVFVVARVFNKPTLEDSSFYVDSEPQNVPTYGGGRYDVVVFNVGATTNELDSTDHDGDGLSRSWEKSYGTNPDNPDTDNDGMSDGHEVLAGTDATDDSSLLLMVQLAPDTGNNLRVYWDSVPGKRYQLQYVEALTNNAQFININGVIKATGDTANTVVTNGLLNPQAMYRIQLVELREDTPPPLTPP